MSRDRFLSDEELERFMAVVRTRRHKHQPRDHALFALLANTGIRPSEALALTRADVHLDGRAPWIRVERRGRPHAPKPTTEIVIHRAVAKVLRVHCHGMDPLAKLWPFTKRQSWRLFHYYSAQAALAPSFRIYCLRHTAGMRFWRFTGDTRIIQAIMGHQHLTSAAVYEHVPPEDVAAVFEATAVRGQT